MFPSSDNSILWLNTFPREEILTHVPLYRGATDRGDGRVEGRIRKAFLERFEAEPEKRKHQTPPTHSELLVDFTRSFKVGAGGGGRQ